MSSGFVEGVKQALIGPSPAHRAEEACWPDRTMAVLTCAACGTAAAPTRLGWP